MSTGRLLALAGMMAINATPASRKIAALLDPDFPPWDTGEKCPYCGITAETVCDRAPIDTCPRALEAIYG